LRPFVSSVWAIDQASATQGGWVPRREHVLPTGGMHLVFRIGDEPLRVFADPVDDRGRIVSTMVVGGARAGFYIREVSTPLCSVGAQLRPGAAQILFGVDADELSGQHTALEALWAAGAGSMRDRLASARSLAERLDVLEQLLASRLPNVRGLHPAVAQALQQFNGATSVGEVVRSSGISHRRFIALFSRSVGLTPKAYSRVLRFQDVLRRARIDGGRKLIDVAATSGYSDQSHFNREFREFAGVTPTEYLGRAPVDSHHLPVVATR
jgi:AraC-like DNA-binding protein